MARAPQIFWQQLRTNHVWRSIFRAGPGGTRLHDSLVVQQNVFLHLFPVKARRRAVALGTTWYLGVMSFGAFLILLITGALLMLYYHPSVPQAYTDIKDLQFVVASGRFLRNLHRWSAHVMVVLVFAHMFRVYYRGAYQPPREFNWVIGVALLLSTLLLSYTGYLLPWDQLSFWAVTVGSNIALAVPLAGSGIRFLMLGGHEVNATALLRFYVLHCIFLPMVAILLLTVHFWRIRKDGGLYVPPQASARDAAAEAALPAREGALR